MESLTNAVRRLKSFVRPEPGFKCGPFIDAPELNDLSIQAQTKRLLLELAEQQLAVAIRPMPSPHPSRRALFGPAIYDTVRNVIECAPERNDWLRFLHSLEELAALNEAAA